jgi:aryl-alcohol dehydrogenase-like predicted oxidoreductase
MTFGQAHQWSTNQWGTDAETSRDIFNHYVDCGGNFIDTAIGYTKGESETLVGKFVRERGLRDKIVIGTKFGPNVDPDNPNTGGNGRKSIHFAVETSLRRLDTDYIDIYWLHFWDTVTPVEEVVDTFDGLVRAGKILHYGFSNVPAWYLARAQTLAEAGGKERAIALQMEYSLVSRYIEREHLRASQEMGLGVCPWSPLGSGFLSGKYKTIGRAGTDRAPAGRLDKTAGSPLFDRDSERNWRILAVLNEVAEALGKPPAQVALSWLAARPGVSSIILGATRLEQFRENLGAASLVIPDDLRARLDAASRIEVVSPYEFFVDPHKSMFRGNFQVEQWKCDATA